LRVQKMSEKKEIVVPKTAKAVTYHKYGESSVLKVEDVPVVPAGEGEVVIQIKAAGLNPADVKIRAGHWSTYPISFPAVPGRDVAGVIVQRGHASRRFNIGDEVYAYIRRPSVSISGGAAQYVTVSEAYVAPKPKKASFEEAAGLPLAGLTAYQGLKLLNLKEGENLVIVGASGGVGSFVVQLAKNVFKAKNVFAIASAKSAEYLKKIGATHFLDYKGDYQAELLKVLPSGADALYDCFGGDWPANAEGLLTDSGRVVTIASWSAPTYKKKPIKFQSMLVEPHSVQLTELANFFDEGKISVHVDKTWKLEEAAKAHDDLIAFHTTGKAVFKIE